MIDLVRDRREAIAELCRRWRVRRLDLFGSATEEADFNPETSDLDFLVEFEAMSPSEHAKSYFGLRDDLAELFKRDVDLVEPQVIRNPFVWSSVQGTREELYVTP
jgi:hypothetical protein